LLLRRLLPHCFKWGPISNYPIQVQPCRNLLHVRHHDSTSTSDFLTFPSFFATPRKLSYLFGSCSAFKCKQSAIQQDFDALRPSCKLFAARSCTHEATPQLTRVGNIFMLSRNSAACEAHGNCRIWGMISVSLLTRGVGLISRFRSSLIKPPVFLLS